MTAVKIKYHERETPSTFDVITVVETTPYGNVVIRRKGDSIARYGDVVATFLLSPDAAHQLIGALTEALTFVEGEK